MLHNLRPSPWMGRALLAAGVYNILWAGWMVFQPNISFEWLGFRSPRTPELCQALALMVGLYGLGYAIAASNPFRHWPIVLIGLIAKVAGTAGFLYSAAMGTMKWSACWLVLFNDVLWWFPFALILRRAYEAHLAKLRCCSREVLNFALRARTSSGHSLDQLSRVSPVLLVFLRHTGCTFCREAISDLARQQEAIRAAGASIVVVHMGPEEHGRELFSKYQLRNAAQISDPTGVLYRAFGLPRGTLRMLFGPKVWWRGFVAGIIERHGIGVLVGDGFQMPGVFLIFHGHVLRSFRHQSAADRPDYLRFVAEHEVPEAVL